MVALIERELVKLEAGPSIVIKASCVANAFEAEEITIGFLRNKTFLSTCMDSVRRALPDAKPAVLVAFEMALKAINGKCAEVLVVSVS